MFEKSLTDLVKGIRAHKNDEQAFLRKREAKVLSFPYFTYRDRLPRIRSKDLLKGDAGTFFLSDIV